MVAVPYQTTRPLSLRDRVERDQGQWLADGGMLLIRPMVVDFTIMINPGWKWSVLDSGFGFMAGMKELL